LDEPPRKEQAGNARKHEQTFGAPGAPKIVGGVWDPEEQDEPTIFERASDLRLRPTVRVDPKDQEEDEQCAPEVHEAIRGLQAVPIRNALVEGGKHRKEAQAKKINAIPRHKGFAR
jgi:hypothetical protein